MTLLLEAIKIALREYLHKQERAYEYDFCAHNFAIHIYNDTTHRQTLIHHHKGFIVVYAKRLGKLINIPDCHPQLLTEIIKIFKECQHG